MRGGGEVKICLGRGVGILGDLHFVDIVVMEGLVFLSGIIILLSLFLVWVSLLL